MTIDTRHLSPGLYGSGEINIATNGGQAKVAVDLSVAAKSKPKPISKPKARLPLRWALIGLGIILFLIAAVGSIYFTYGHLSAPSPTLAIQGVSAYDITDTSANVTWTTDKPATGQAEYGHTADLGSTTALDEELVTSHNVELTGLQPNTTYYFKVISKDAGGREATSDTSQLTTLPTAAPTSSPPQPQPPASTPPVEVKPSFKAKAYTNDTYGFSVEYPKDWVARPDMMLTPYHVAVFSVDAFVPGIVMVAFDAAAPESVDWIKSSVALIGGSGPKVQGDIKETKTLDGSTAYTYKLGYISSTGYLAEGYVMDVDRGAKRIRFMVYTVAAFADYDQKLFEEIVHTVRFTAQ